MLMGLRSSDRHAATPLTRGPHEDRAHLRHPREPALARGRPRRIAARATSRRRIISGIWLATRQPNEVVERIVAAGIAGVAGNYDSTVATHYKHCGCRAENPRQEELRM